MDLDAMDKYLDKVLESETTESITSWLNNKRIEKYLIGFDVALNYESNQSTSFIYIIKNGQLIEIIPLNNKL